MTILCASLHRHLKGDNGPVERITCVIIYIQLDFCNPFYLHELVLIQVLICSNIHYKIQILSAMTLFGEWQRGNIICFLFEKLYNSSPTT